MSELEILVGDRVTVLRGKLKGQTYLVWDHWTAADGKKRVQLNVPGGPKTFHASSVKPVEPETDDHDCHAHLIDVRMSDCRYDCKVWRCQKCGDEMLIHMAVYGCENKVIDLPRKPQLEGWLCPGDTFTSWTGITGILALSSPDENGLFEAIIPGVDDNGSRWHSDAVEPGTVRRPVADACPDSCPRCGADLAAMDRPTEHQHVNVWGDDMGTCAFTWQVPVASGHSCDAYLIDVRTSDCRYSCKIWRCQRCGREHLIHMAVYGCENQVIDVSDR